MTIIREDDIVQSVADALQFISCYHPADYVRHLSAAHEREESPAAKEAIGQILMNQDGSARPPADVPGYRYGERFRARRHSRAHRDDPKPRRR